MKTKTKLTKAGLLSRDAFGLKLGGDRWSQNISLSLFFFLTSSQSCGRLERQAHYLAPGHTVSSIFIHHTQATSLPLRKRKKKLKKNILCPHIQCLQPYFQMEVNGKEVALAPCVPPG